MSLAPFCQTEGRHMLPFWKIVVNIACNETFYIRAISKKEPTQYAIDSRSNIGKGDDPTYNCYKHNGIQPILK